MAHTASQGIRLNKNGAIHVVSLEIGRQKNTPQIIDLQCIYIISVYLRRESNSDLKFRKLLFYPLNYRGRPLCVQMDAWIWNISHLSVPSVSKGNTFFALVQIHGVICIRHATLIALFTPLLRLYFASCCHAQTMRGLP